MMEMYFSSVADNAAMKQEALSGAKILLDARQCWYDNLLAVLQ